MAAKKAEKGFYAHTAKNLKLQDCTLLAAIQRYNHCFSVETVESELKKKFLDNFLVVFQNFLGYLTARPGHCQGPHDSIQH